MSVSEIEKISDENLDQVNGGLDGSSSGHWMAATVKSPAGLPGYFRKSGGFVRDGKMLIPFGEDVTADMNRTSGKYVVVFYDDREAWVEKSGLEFL